MRRRDVTWGLLFLVLGALLLLGPLGYGGVNWDAVWRLWPGLLIYAGLIRIFEYVGV